MAIINVPNPLKTPLLRIKIRPSPPRMIVSLDSPLIEICLSLISIKRETSIELKNKATIREDPNTTERVMGK